MPYRDDGRRLRTTDRGGLLNKTCLLWDRPLTPYKTVWEDQLRLVRAKRERRLRRDVVILVEHPPVFTLGRHASKEHLLVSLDFLRQQGIELYRIERGGDLTYHCPGQLVVYPVMDLRGNGMGIKELVFDLEEAMIATARHFGVNSKRGTQNRGVWIEDRKIGSIGLALRQGITFHGLAFNIQDCLAPFSWINPCGLPGIKMTSLAMESGQSPATRDVREIIKKHLARLLNLSFVPVDTYPSELARHSPEDKVLKQSSRNQLDDIL